jgi:hypothetical protein
MPATGSYDVAAGKKDVICRRFKSGDCPLCNGSHAAHTREIGSIIEQFYQLGFLNPAPLKVLRSAEIHSTDCHH